MKLKNFRLKELRLRKNIKQIDLATYFQVTPRTFRQWENNEIDLPSSKLIKVAEYFNVSIDYLVGNDDVPNRKES